MDSTPGTTDRFPPHHDADRSFTRERLFSYQSRRVRRSRRRPGLFADASAFPVVRYLVDLFRHGTGLVSPAVEAMEQLRIEHVRKEF